MWRGLAARDAATPKAQGKLKPTGHGVAGLGFLLLTVTGLGPL